MKKMLFGYEVTQRTTEKKLENHRENISGSLCGSLLKLCGRRSCGSLCNLIPEYKNRKPFLFRYNYFLEYQYQFRVF